MATSSSSLVVLLVLLSSVMVIGVEFLCEGGLVKAKITEMSDVGSMGVSAVSTQGFSDDLPTLRAPAVCFVPPSPPCPPCPRSPRSPSSRGYPSSPRSPRAPASPRSPPCPPCPRSPGSPIILKPWSRGAACFDHG